MYYIGIDIGSTASKYVVLNNEKNEILYKEVISSGWNSKETGRKIIKKLEDLGYDRKESHITATGYGRIAVDFADKIITAFCSYHAILNSSGKSFTDSSPKASCNKSAVFTKEYESLHWPASKTLGIPFISPRFNLLYLYFAQPAVKIT